MNPLTKVRLINELNEREADLGIKETVSWHSEYSDSAWIFVGGLPYELSEGDVVCVFSQYGEVVNMNLVRDKKTGKSKGFCFICYEDQRSTILAVDNFNGIKIKGRTLRVDHVKDYKPPKDHEDIDDITRSLREQGCAPSVSQGAGSVSQGAESEEELVPVKKSKKDKKEKKKKKKEKKKKRELRSPSSSVSPPRAVAASARPGADAAPAIRVKEERHDAGYDKYRRTEVQQGAQWREEESQQGPPRGRDREEWRQEEERREPKRERREERIMSYGSDMRREETRREEGRREEGRREEGRREDGWREETRREDGRREPKRERRDERSYGSDRSREEGRREERSSESHRQREKRREDREERRREDREERRREEGRERDREDRRQDQ
ncbi:unnamed protein product [Knipowitschia caucasica]